MKEKFFVNRETPVDKATVKKAHSEGRAVLRHIQQGNGPVYTSLVLGCWKKLHREGDIRTWYTKPSLKKALAMVKHLPWRI